MSDLPRFAIFGDSHYACLKQAELLGLVDMSGAEVEHWGHVGGRFLHLEFRDGAVHPTDEFTARRFAKFNEKGRTFLPAADFDVVLVMGARSYVLHPFQIILAAAAHGPFMSAGLQRRVVADSLRRQIGYQFAAGLAAEGQARVIMTPTSFPTERAERPQPDFVARPEARAEIWQFAREAAAEDGIDLIAQPEETVVNGLFTSAAYAVEEHERKKDYAHRNAAYGALILERAMQIVRQTARRA